MIQNLSQNELCDTLRVPEEDRLAIRLEGHGGGKSNGSVAFETLTVFAPQAHGLEERAKRLSRRARSWLLLALLLPACASTASYHDGWLEKDGHRLRVGTLPEGWERVAVGEEDLAFRDNRSNAVITTQMTCDKQYDDAPLKSLTRHLWFGLTSVEVAEQKTRPLGGRDALDTTVNAKLDGVPVRLRTIVSKKDGCIHDFTLSQPRPDDGWEAASAALENWADGE